MELVRALVIAVVAMSGWRAFAQAVLAPTRTRQLIRLA
jgi:hypothetical protein